MNSKIPHEDAAFLQEVIDGARNLYGTVGRTYPCVFLRTADGALPSAPANMLILAMPEIGGSEAHKLHAIDRIRHHSIRLGSPRSAILAESWGITVGENTERELLDLRRQGKHMGDHPDSYEIVSIIIESDLGRTYASLSIDRRHKHMTVLEPTGDETFVPANSVQTRAMFLTNFHVPMVDRISPNMIAWANEMDREYGDPRIQSGDHSELSSEGSTPISTRH